MTDEKRNQLKALAQQVRCGVINATHAAKSGHPGGSLGASDIFTYLYFEEMNINPESPCMPERDRFVLSKGHNAPGLYSVLAARGYFPEADLLTLRQQGSYLQGHPCLGKTPGVDMSTGSLGQGVSAAAGMALGAKAQSLPYRVYTLLGDGELAEGEVWEALMFAAHYKLDNLCVIIDRNGLQIDGATKEVMGSEPLEDKIKAFGFTYTVVNGNDFDELEAAFAKARETKGAPFAIIANTIKGKGVSFMENEADWHGKAPNDAEKDQALAELRGEA